MIKGYSILILIIHWTKFIRFLLIKQGNCWMFDIDLIIIWKSAGSANISKIQEISRLEIWGLCNYTVWETLVNSINKYELFNWRLPPLVFIWQLAENKFFINLKRFPQMGNSIILELNFSFIHWYFFFFYYLCLKINLSVIHFNF